MDSAAGCACISVHIIHTHIYVCYSNNQGKRRQFMGLGENKEGGMRMENVMQFYFN